DDPFLFLDRDGVPGGEVVQVFLHDQVATAGEVRLAVLDDGRLFGVRTGRVLGAVDEAHQVPFVEVFESVRLVHHGGGAGQLLHQLAGQLEAQVHPPGPQVENQVARGRNRRVPGTDDLAERVQVGRARAAEEPVPGVRPHADHALQLAVGD